MDESFEQTAHRVLEEHRALRVQMIGTLLARNCRCQPRHTAEMVLRSLQVCDWARTSVDVSTLDAIVWALDDIHATLYPEHENERLN